MSTKEFKHLEEKRKRRERKREKGSSFWVEENQESIVMKVQRGQYFKKEGVVDSGEDCWKFK